MQAKKLTGSKTLHRLQFLSRHSKRRWILTELDRLITTVLVYTNPTNKGKER
jgi:hypothetical protein